MFFIIVTISNNIYAFANYVFYSRFICFFNNGQYEFSNTIKIKFNKFQHKYAMKNILASKAYLIKKYLLTKCCTIAKRNYTAEMDDLQITNKDLLGHITVTGETYLTYKVQTKNHLG